MKTATTETSSITRRTASIVVLSITVSCATNVSIVCSAMRFSTPKTVQIVDAVDFSSVAVTAQTVLDQ